MKYNFFYKSIFKIASSNNRPAKSLVIPLAVAVIGCSSKGNQDDKLAKESFPVISLTSKTQTTYQEYPAAIQGTVDLEIRPQISGRLDANLVNEGAFVQKGELLFKIDQKPFTEEVNKADAQLRSAKAAWRNAQLEVEKLTPLVSNKVVSDFQLKTAQSNEESAQANVSQGKAALAAANINLGYTLIKAPVTGYIGRLPKKQGSLVSVSDTEPLTQLSDTHEVHVYFSLSEDDFNAFNVQYSGKSVTERLKHLPLVSLVLSDKTLYEQKGKIDMVDGQFDKQTGSIALRATFPNTKGILKSGNTGKIRLPVVHQNAVLIPQGSTIEIQDKVFVYRVASGTNKVSKIPVHIKASTGTDYLVNEGLKSGDIIVYDGIDKLKEDQIIAPQRVQKESTTKATR